MFQVCKFMADEFLSQNAALNDLSAQLSFQRKKRKSMQAKIKQNKNKAVNG
jgi:hypothetical protein